MTVKRRLKPKSHDIEVLVPDTAKLEQKANNAIRDRRFVSRVFRQGEWPIRDSWYSTMGELYRRLNICKQEGIEISTEFVLRLVGLIEKAYATHKKDKAGELMYAFIENPDVLPDNEEMAIFTQCKVTGSSKIIYFLHILHLLLKWIL